MELTAPNSLSNQEAETDRQRLDSFGCIDSQTLLAKINVNELISSNILLY